MLDSGPAFAPENPRWTYLLGHSYLSDADAAIPLLREAAQLADRYDSSNSVPRIMFAETLLLKGEHAEAKRQLEQVLENEPNNARAHYDLALLSLADRDPESALKHLAESEKSPAARKKSLGQLAAAHHALAERPDLNAEERQAHRSLADGYAQRATEQPEDSPWSDPYLREVVELDASRQRQYERAADLVRSGHGAEAVALLDALVEQTPDPDSFLELARTLVAVKQFDRAEQAARQCLKMQPEKVQAQFLLGLALFRQGVRAWNAPSGSQAAARQLFQDAEEQLRRALATMPTHALACVYRGRCLRYLDRHAEAAEAFRTAIHQNPRQSDAYIFLARLLAEDGKQTEADAVLDKARRALPNDADVRRAWEGRQKGLSPPIVTRE